MKASSAGLTASWLANRLRIKVVGQSLRMFFSSIGDTLKSCRPNATRTVFGGR
jgi:hypothetical protein